MGKLRGPYNAEFPIGSTVRVAAREVLLRFQRPQWQYHNPLAAEQLAYAGQVSTVTDLGYYHGGDELYQLEGIPGTWHEECLEAFGDGADA